MKAFNKKRKMKHTTKIKWREWYGVFFTQNRINLSKSYTQNNKIVEYTTFKKYEIPIY